MSHKTKPIICLMGPTASGKTALAVNLAQRLNGEVISVDSALIYRDMNIGTAKPSAEEKQGIPHHLIDICDPAESYSAAEFAKSALQLIEDILARGRWPIMAGGTMLYFKTLFEGMARLPATEQNVRDEVNRVLKSQGAQSLHEWLQRIDPVSAKRLHPNDPQRITRAIEVFLISGKPLSQWHHEQQLEAFPYPAVSFAIAPAERAELHQRIEQRFDTMIELGFEREVRGLYQRGDLTLEMPSMRCVGYRQFWSHFDGDYDLAEARFRGIVATRQLAKRQFTWLRSWEDVVWLDSLAKNNVDMVLKKIATASI